MTAALSELFAQLNETNDQDPDSTLKVLEEIKNNLLNIIDSMGKNPSHFSRAAKYWGQIPLWQKILGGITVGAPPLILSLVFHIISLLIIGSIAALLYAAAGITLDDHNNCTAVATESLKKGISGLADLLGALFQKLKIICDDFNVQVGLFKQENIKLTEQINVFCSEVTAVAKLNTSLLEMVNPLQYLKNVFVESAKTIEENTTTLKQNSANFNKMHEELAQTLAQKNEELKTSSATIKELKDLVALLKKAIETTFTPQSSTSTKLEVLMNDADNLIAQQTVLTEELNKSHKQTEKLNEELASTMRFFARKTTPAPSTDELPANINATTTSL